MKISRLSRLPASPRFARSVAGFTLAELMIAMTIFAMTVLAVLVANILGLKEEQLMESKAGSCDSSRLAVQTLIQDIHCANAWDIGTISNFTSMSGSSFQLVNSGSGTNLQGNALRLYPHNNTNDYLIYYFNPTVTDNGVLMRWWSTNSATAIVASNLIDDMTFYGEDYSGNLRQTNNDYTLVVHTALHFCQFQYPTTQVGSNFLYNSYTIELRATPFLPSRL